MNIKEKTADFIGRDLLNLTQKRSDLRATHEWLRAFLTCFLVWMLPNIMGFAAKYRFLSKHGFAYVAGALSLNSLSIGQRLSFFRADLLLGLLLIPICLALIRVLLPVRLFRWFAGTVTVFAVLLQMVAFAELAVLGSLAAGYGLLAEGLEWGIAHPKAALNYLMAHNFPRLLVTPVIMAGGAAVPMPWVWPILRFSAPSDPETALFCGSYCLDRLLPPGACLSL